LRVQAFLTALAIKDSYSLDDCRTRQNRLRAVSQERNLDADLLCVSRYVLYFSRHWTKGHDSLPQQKLPFLFLTRNTKRNSMRQEASDFRIIPLSCKSRV
jgi:hypothetical protein